MPLLTTFTAIRAVLDAAEAWVLAAIYGIERGPPVDARLAAQSRGIWLRVKVDRDRRRDNHDQAAAVQDLVDGGVWVQVSARSRQMHNKFVVIDGWRVVTASYNWTPRAERNYRENVVILDCAELAADMAEKWGSIE